LIGLGRAVRSIIRPTPASPPPENHRKTNWLRDVILGGQDGLVNMLGIALGVIAAAGSTHVLIVTGWAAAVTESLSMGAVAYTSYGAERNYFRAEREQEEREIDTTPEVERREVRDIFAAKGFDGELLDRVVETITANRDVWIDTMMKDELDLSPVANNAILRSSAVVNGCNRGGSRHPARALHGHRPHTCGRRVYRVERRSLVRGRGLLGKDARRGLAYVGDEDGRDRVRAAGIGFLIGRLFHTAGV
jgi:hypothetical protein